MIAPDPTKLITVKEFAQRIRVSLASAYQIIQGGEIPSIRTGPRRGLIRVLSSDVDQYLANSLTQPPLRAANRIKAPIKPHGQLRHIRLK